jgi:RNA polymerase sigma factor (sigma-70 family)
LAVIPERMRDARDAEDALLLQNGDHPALIAAWYDVIVQRCLARVAGPSAWDVAHDAVERLLGELQRGRRYPVPFRVVVHNVVTWTLKEHWQGLPTEGPLPEDWDPAATESGFGQVEQQLDLERMFEDLPDGDRLVAKLRYLDGLEIAEIADRLGKQRNAIDQSLYRAHAALAKAVSG